MYFGYIRRKWLKVPFDPGLTANKAYWEESIVSMIDKSVDVDIQVTLGKFDCQFLAYLDISVPVSDRICIKKLLTISFHPLIEPCFKWPLYRKEVNYPIWTVLGIIRCIVKCFT